MFVDMPREIEIFAYPCFSAVFLYLCDGTLDVTTIMLRVNLEGFLFRPFRGVGPVTFRRFFHTIHIRYLSTAYPYLLEVIPALVVVKAVDGEDLLSLNRCQSEDSRDVIVSILEFGLVKQNFHVAVVDDSLLDDGRINHVVQFLCHNSSDAVELTHRLVEILDIFCHRRRGDSFPCLFDDESLSTFLDTHLLEKHIHDDEHHDRETALGHL